LVTKRPPMTRFPLAVSPATIVLANDGHSLQV
jgi:hypothetical protein